MSTPETDEEGYLVEPATWTEEIAHRFAAQENIQLTDDHWAAIRFMRDYYAEHQVAPDVRHVMKHLATRPGNEGRNRIFELFPYGYVKQACKIAGMKRPRAWSTG
jgi:TusE/DsrC/DsvC family sulfur relay protein